MIECKYKKLYLIYIYIGYMPKAKAPKAPKAPNAKTNPKAKADPTLLSEGAYGCVYKPGVQCDGSKMSKNYVSKIQKKKARTMQEPIIGQKIREKLPQYAYYFAPAMDVCPAVLTSIQKSELKKCTVIDERAPKDEFIALKIAYVGKHTLGANLSIHAKQDPQTFYSHVLDTHQYLARAIDQLVNLRIIHHDIKQNNVMYSEKWHVPIIIDFGVAFQVDQLYDNETLKMIFFSHYEKYPPWCPEIMCIAAIINQDQTQPQTNNKWETQKVPVSQLQSIIKTYFRESPLVTNHTKTISTYQKQWISYLKTFENKTGKTALKMLLQHWNTWDVYSTNAMYYALASSSNPPLPENYRTYLMDQLFCIPSKRNEALEISEAIDQFMRET